MCCFNFDFLLSLSITDKNFKCWYGSTVRTKRIPGYSIDCEEREDLASCSILFSDVGAKRHVFRGCSRRRDPNEGILGKCVPTVDHLGQNATLCLCNDGDDCNKDQIDGMPPSKRGNGAVGTGNLFVVVESLVLVVGYYINI